MNSTTTTKVPVREILEIARRAPSVHNTQPWRWVVDGDRVSLFADYGRQLAQADPDGRDLVISCGAALHHLRVAATAAGWQARIHRMPNAYNDAQLATISFEAFPASAQDARILDALLRRRTDRRRLSAWPVARDRLSPLLQTAGEFGVVAFGVVSPQARRLVLNLLDEADRVQRRDPDYLDEVTRWSDREDGSGVPASSRLRHPPASDDRGAGTRFPSGNLEDTYLGDDEPADALVVVCSSSDDTSSRLRAGEALSAILLDATASGLATTTLSQATEVSTTRGLLQDDLIKDAANPQILVRLGWPEDGLEPLRETPRRPLDELVVKPSDLPAGFGSYRMP